MIRYDPTPKYADLPIETTTCGMPRLADQT